MKEVKIAIYGCDDTTRFSMKVTDEEYGALQTLSKMSIDTSEIGCQPIVILDDDWSYYQAKRDKEED